METCLNIMFNIHCFSQESFLFSPCFSSTRQNRGATSSPRRAVEPGRLKCHQAPLAFLLPAAYDGHHEKRRHPGLFSAFADRPLADRLRPSALEDIMGQDHLLGEGGPLRLMADSGKMTSFILWGPPGCGKTTLARILATRTSMHFAALRRLLRHGGFEKSL